MNENRESHVQVTTLALPDAGARSSKVFAPLAMLFVAMLLMQGLWLASAQGVAGVDATATITFGAETVIDGQGASADGAHVTIDQAGTYVLVGSSSDGSVTVDAADADVRLVLAGVELTNPNGPALFFKAAGSAAVTLQDGTSNTITDGGESEFDAALYSDASLTIDGDGSLDVHAVYEGISSTMHIDILGGSIRIFATEDGINANNDGVSHIDISGGYVYIETGIGDGIDSNGTITISGGTVIAQSALVGGNSGLDADGAITIDGGLVIASGGSMLGSVSADSSQSSLLIEFGPALLPDTLVTVRDPSGVDVVTFAPSQPFVEILVSTPALQDDVEYTVYTGGVGSGEAVDGLYADGASEPGTVFGTVTTASAVGGGRFGPSAPGGQGGPGFGPGGGRGGPRAP